MSNLILKIVFFGLSLHSYYSYEFSMPIVSVGCLVLMFFLIISSVGFRLSEISIDRVSLSVLILYLLFMLWSEFGLIYHGDYPSSKRVATFVMMMAMCLIASSLYKAVSLESLIRFFLSAHVFFFFFQFVAFFGFNTVIDYFYVFTGEEQRMFGGTFTIPVINRFARMAGLFIEPGTYCTFLVPFIAVFGRWYDNSRQNKFVFWASIFSIFLSFSFFGVIFALIILLFAKFISFRLKIVSFGFCSVIAVPYLYDRLILRPEKGLPTGLEIRQTYLERSFEYLTQNLFDFSFGAGFLTTDARANLGMAVNDIGIWGYMLHFSGAPLFLFVLAIAWPLYLSSLPRENKVAFVLTLFSKQTIFAPFFPLALIAILWKRDVI